MCSNHDLELATEGACKGHLCDNCKICQSGRCCRKDNPDYKLPELGEWNGPIYGELGMLADTGDQVECHCCGQWFQGLSRHVWSKHNLTAEEYKAIFGLIRSRGLCSARSHEKRVAASRNMLAKRPDLEQRFKEAGVQSRSAERMHYLMAGRPQREEYKKKASDVSRRSAQTKGNGTFPRIIECVICGKNRLITKGSRKSVTCGRGTECHQQLTRQKALERVHANPADYKDKHTRLKRDFSGRFLKKTADDTTLASLETNDVL